ncbi:uncharacterized protein C10orf143 homolog isoform X2 [Canis lupus baileyi]|uniref:uncharacterized protein C10orf143 homolog isoform X2 n=1 Tax=Canis lupus baileyi TaxID=143281 RepID=UPI003B96AE20
MGFLICTTNSNSRSSSLINKQRPGKAADESRRRQRGSSLNALGRDVQPSRPSSLEHFINCQRSPWPSAVAPTRPPTSAVPQPTHFRPPSP